MEHAAGPASPLDAPAVPPSGGSSYGGECTTSKAEKKPTRMPDGEGRGYDVAALVDGIAGTEDHRNGAHSDSAFSP